MSLRPCKYYFVNLLERLQASAFPHPANQTAAQYLLQSHLPDNYQNTNILPPQAREYPYFAIPRSGYLHFFTVKSMPHLTLLGFIISTPYDPDAKCPKYDATLSKILANDPELIELADQWHGYVICYDTSLHKMVIAYGEGGTGKSTWLTVSEMLVGRDNCSHVSPDMFGERFQLASTVGKLLNTVAEEPDIDKVSVGKLKQFVSADPMQIERKGVDCFTTKPTARVMLGTNTLPHLNDSSEGAWRRLIMMPFDVMIPEEEMIHDLDEQLEKELPGIFNRAIRGRASLMKNGRFIEPKVCKELRDQYRLDCDPTRAYLQDNYAIDGTYIVKADMYQHYKQWAIDNGHRPLGESKFAQQVKRIFKVEDGRLSSGDRKRVWYKLRPTYLDVPEAAL